MIKWSIGVSTVLAVVILGTASVPAQTGYRAENEFGEPRFAVEAVDFRTDQEGLHTLEIYYKIFYDGLSYRKLPQGYRAEYEVAIVVEGKDGQQIEGIIREGDVEVRTFAETRRATDFIINQVTVTFNEQDIKVRAALTDKVSGNVYDAEQKLDRRKYWEKYPTLSRVEFSRELTPAVDGSKFNKDNTRVIPNVSRKFGGDFDTLLSYYQEVYPGRASVKYAKKISNVYHRVKGTVYSDTVDYGEINESKREIRTINIADFVPGDYELEIRLEGRRGRLYDKMNEEFELLLTAETMFRNDYESAVEMLKYLATREEMKKLKNAGTAQERRERWDEFWRLRDEYRHDRENPTKEEYFRRIRHSDRNFSIMRKAGWRTSRGMIYVTYGEPDEVEDYPFELSTKPYQVWLYYRLSPPRKFLFIDEWGDGNYELQPPYNGIDW